MSADGGTGEVLAPPTSERWVGMGNVVLLVYPASDRVDPRLCSSGAMQYQLVRENDIGF